MEEVISGNDGLFEMSKRNIFGNIFSIFMIDSTTNQFSSVILVTGLILSAA